MVASRAGMMCPPCLADKGIDPVKRQGRAAPYRSLTLWQRCSWGATAEWLLAAVERLVVRKRDQALRGRGIVALAALNSALVRYHFGDADGLLRDLALRNAARIADPRTGLLDALACLTAMR